MKRLIVSALCISVFFVGLGSLVEKAGAKFNSDEKALALIRAAKTAIGGESAVANIQSLRIKGTTSHSFKIDGVDRTESGEKEIALQLPNKLSKTVRIGKHDGDDAGERIVNKRVETVVIRKDKDGNEIVGTGRGEGTGIGISPGERKVIIVEDGDRTGELKTEGGEKVIVRRHDGEMPLKTENGDVRKIEEEMIARHSEMKQNELFRLTLGLLLSPPVEMAVNYTFGGETTIDNTPCNLVVAEVGGSSVKLYLDRGSNLPVMMAYTGEHMPMMIRFNKETPTPGNGEKDVLFFKKVHGPEATAEFQVRFSDYRSVGGVQLPYRWTTAAGEMREVFDVSSYEVNPADIAESFKDHKMMIRTKRPEGQ
jgi:hypothetical protein